jgi:hypothetical protein
MRKPQPAAGSRNLRREWFSPAANDVDLRPEDIDAMSDDEFCDFVDRLNDADYEALFGPLEDDGSDYVEVTDEELDGWFEMELEAGELGEWDEIDLEDGHWGADFTDCELLDANEHRQS